MFLRAFKEHGQLDEAQAQDDNKQNPAVDLDKSSKALACVVANKPLYLQNQQLYFRHYT